MPPKVSKIDSSLACRLHLILRAALVTKIANTIFKKAQDQEKEQYDMHVLFEPHFAAGDYGFVERSP